MDIISFDLKRHKLASPLMPNLHSENVWRIVVFHVSGRVDKSMYNEVWGIY